MRYLLLIVFAAIATLGCPPTWAASVDNQTAKESAMQTAKPEIMRS